MMEPLFVYGAAILFVVFLAGGVLTIVVGIAEALSDFGTRLSHHSGRAVGVH